MTRTRPIRPIRPRVVVAALALTGALLAGCGYDATPVPNAESASEEPSVPPPSTQDCGDPARSYAPEGTVAQLRDGRGTRAIERRDRLVVGISADSYLLGSRDPISGDFEGFDIDMVRAVARAIFPLADAEQIDDKITYRVITAADRIPALESGRVDLVVRNFSITCDRWEQIAFSATYYESGQQVLVISSLEDEVDGPEDLGGLRVCAPDGTTSLTNIVEAAPEAEIVPAANHTDCLVKLQAGEVDAITGDDTVLAGLSAQDPYAVVPTGQESFSREPYGIGVSADNPDLVRLVNAVLEQSRTDGTWEASYNQWLRPELGPATQPQPVYGRE